MKQENKIRTVLDTILIFLLAILLFLKIVTCLAGCGDEYLPPDTDAKPPKVFVDIGLIEPDSHQIICGDRICEYPETMTNCSKDCLPGKWKSDSPFDPYDPGYIDPVDPPGQKR